VKIYTISTLHDWAHFTGAAGPTGIERMFDWMAIARIERVYWRVFEGGLATYPSKIATVFRGRDVEAWRGLGEGGGTKSEQWALREDCSKWDALALAVEVAHRRGIELCAWWTLCEEDHGGHVGSRFGQRRQARLHDRRGKDYPGTVELLLPEVREYRMAVLDEILERNVDGLLLDFVRNNATPSAGPDGVHRFGFNLPVRQAYQREHGVDPVNIPADDENWLAFKNRGRADFVRQIRQRIGSTSHLAVMTIPHVDNYRWLCLDLPALSADRTFDLVMPFGMSYCNNPQTTAEHVGQLHAQVRGRHTRVAAGIQAYWGITPDAYDAAIDAADEAGAKSVVLYEADMICRMNLLTPTRARHLNAPRVSRCIDVKLLRRKPTARDWSKAAEYRGFFVVTGPDRAKPAAATRFQVLAGPRALHVRVACEGKQADVSAELMNEKRVYLEWIAGRNFWMRSDKAHVLIDPLLTRQDYAHFSGDRLGGSWAEKRFRNPWPADWTCRVKTPTPRRWIAEFEIPYKTLGAKPRRGTRWGFQIIREHCAEREVSSWFVSTAYGVDPAEWGEMTFV